MTELNTNYESGWTHQEFGDLGTAKSPFNSTQFPYLIKQGSYLFSTYITVRTTNSSISKCVTNKLFKISGPWSTNICCQQRKNIIFYIHFSRRHTYVLVGKVNIHSVLSVGYSYEIRKTKLYRVI